MPPIDSRDVGELPDRLELILVRPPRTLLRDEAVKLLQDVMAVFKS